MIGFILLIGGQGAGKTLMMTKLGLTELEESRKSVFSNYTLFGVKYTPITFNPAIEKNKGKLDILKTLDDNPDYFNNSIMLIDELHLYLDSLDFMRKNNRRLQTFFSQLRKRKILLLGTTQYLMNVDIRIRRQAMNVIEMENKGRGIFRANTHVIDGYWTKPVSTYLIDLRAYYERFDTNEVIL